MNVSTEHLDQDAPVVLKLDDDYGDIREAVRRICAEYPGAYWRELEEREAYPTEFVKALTEAGFLGSLIPEEYGGSGLPLRAASAILEETKRLGSEKTPCEWRKRR